MALFLGVPGGIELLIIFLVMVLLVGVPLALLAVVVLVGRRSAAGESAGADRDLETEVASLRREVQALRAELAGDGTGGSGGDDAADGSGDASDGSGEAGDDGTGGSAGEE